MEYLILARCGSFLGVAALNLYPNWIQAESFFNASLLGHYLISAIYSKNQFYEVLRGSIKLRGWLVLIALFSIVQWTPIFIMPVYFGIHFILSEIYNGKWINSKTIRFLRWSSSTCLYLLCNRFVSPISSLPMGPLWAIFGASVLGLGCVVISGSFNRQERAHGLGIVVYEFIGVIGVLSLLAVPHTYRDVLTLHTIWWLIYPFEKLRGVYLWKYLFITVATTAIFFVITPAAHTGYSVSLESLFRTGLFLGNIHITLSFVTSPSNPQWIKRLFRTPAPEPIPVAATA